MNLDNLEPATTPAGWKNSWKMGLPSAATSDKMEWRMIGSVDLLPGSQVTEASASTALMTVYAEVSLSAASGVNNAATLPLKESQSHLLTSPYFRPCFGKA